MGGGDGAGEGSRGEGTAPGGDVGGVAVGVEGVEGGEV